MNTFMRHIPAALLLIVLAGCSIDDSYRSVGTEGKKLTIKVIREDDEPETRTLRNDKGKVYWSKGDQISLFYGQGSNGGSVFTSNQEADTVKVTNFVGTITAITGGGEISADETYFWGLYPYNETASCDGNSITTTLSSHQEAYPGSYANGANISVGRSQGLIMGFYNACGGFRFSLNKEGVKKVTFRGNNGENLAGKLNITFVKGKIKTEVIEGKNEVVLEAPAGKYFEPGVLYYIVLAPTVLSNGFSVKAETFTEETTFTYGSSITIEASNFKSKKLMDLGLTWTKKTGNIPVEDANFKAYLVENFDDNGDGEISYNEAAGIQGIDVCTDEIESVSGIEYMGLLESLKCYGSSYDSSQGNSGQLSSLDVSNNAALTFFYCYNNQLNSLDVSNNSALIDLRCSHNQLTSLDVSNNKALKILYCYNNSLTNLDVSNNTSLAVLSCASNDLTSLDVSNNKALKILYCYFNPTLNNLDVSNNTALEQLYCYSNWMTSLDVTNNTELKKLICYYNNFTSLDISKNTALTSFDCRNNHLTSLDVSRHTALTDLLCGGNPLTSLDVSNNTMLIDLYCNSNQLTNLDVSNNPALESLFCESNQLTSLDVSNNTALTCLYCYSNRMTTLDISNNVELKELRCSNNPLATLYIDQGQEIPYVTTNRNVDHIPLETEIVVKPDDGGTGDNTDDEL